MNESLNSLGRKIDNLTKKVDSVIGTETPPATDNVSVRVRNLGDGTDAIHVAWSQDQAADAGATSHFQVDVLDSSNTVIATVDATPPTMFADLNIPDVAGAYTARVTPLTADGTAGSAGSAGFTVVLPPPPPPPPPVPAPVTGVSVSGDHVQ